MYSSIIWITLIIGGVIALIYLQQKNIRKFKAEYEEALQGLDKRKALEAGRKYYRCLRAKGVLTIYDEQAITNDMAAMDDVKKIK